MRIQICYNIGYINKCEIKGFKCAGACLEWHCKGFDLPNFGLGLGKVHWCSTATPWARSWVPIRTFRPLKRWFLYECKRFVLLFV